MTIVRAEPLDSNLKGWSGYGTEEPYIVSSPVRYGSGSVHLRHRINVGAGSGMRRSQILLRYDPDQAWVWGQPLADWPKTLNDWIRKEWWVGWRIYVPPDFKPCTWRWPDGTTGHAYPKVCGAYTLGSGGELWWQIHPYGTPPQITLYINYDESNPTQPYYKWSVRGRSIYDCADDEIGFTASRSRAWGNIMGDRGHWRDWVLHLVPDIVRDRDSFTEILTRRDDEGTWTTVVGASEWAGVENAVNSCHQPVFSMGPYIWDSDTTRCGAYCEISERVIYIDDLRIGDQNSSADEVCPLAGTTTTTTSTTTTTTTTTLPPAGGIAVTTIASNTSTGTQDITSSDLGGATPNAALFLWTHGETLDTDADHNMMGVGACDDTNEWALVAWGEDGEPAASASTYRRGYSTHCIVFGQEITSVTDGMAQFSAFIPNGVRVNWTEAPSEAKLLTVVLFNLSDVYVGTATPATTEDASVDVTAPGFEPDFVVFAGDQRAFDVGAVDFAVLGLGFAWNGASTVQRSGGYLHYFNTSPTDTEGGVEENRCLVQLTGSVYDFTLELTAWLANGFTLTTRDSAVNNSGEVGYLALGGLSDIWLGTINTPTSIGNVSYESAGFLPGMLLGLASFRSATGYTRDATVGTWAFLTSDGSDHRALNAQWEDGAATSQAQSHVAATWELFDHSGATTELEGTPSLDADGFDVNWTTVDGTSRYWFVAALQATTTTSSTTTTTTTTTLAPAALGMGIASTICNTSTGTQDITTDLGDATPVAGLFVLSFAMGNDAAVANAGGSVGAADGSAQWAICFAAEDNLGGTQTGGTAHDDACVLTPDPTYGQVTGRAVFDSFITNGVRIDWVDAPPAAYRIDVYLWYGTGLQADVGTFAVQSVQDAATDVTAPGFTPQLVAVAGLDTLFNETTYYSPDVGMGLAVYDVAVSQGSVAFYWRDGQPAGVAKGSIRTNRVYQHQNDWAVELADFDASGFSAYTRDATGPANVELGYLAIRYGADAGVWLDDVTTRTTVGSKAYMGAGFEPNHALFLSSFFTTTNTYGAGTSVGLGGANALEEAHQNWADEDAADPTNANSKADTKCLNLMDLDGSDGYEATLTTFDSDGLTLDFTVVDGTERYFIAAAMLGGTTTTSTTTTTTTTSTTTTLPSSAFDVVTVACNTNLGNQDITGDLGGATPNAALFFVTRATALNANADHFVFGMGAATDASYGRWAWCAAGEDAAAGADTWRRETTLGCVLIIDPTDGTVDGEAGWVSFIANGIRINWNNAPAAGYQLTVVLFSAPQVRVQSFSPAGTQDASVDVTNTGFEPDFVVFCGADVPLDATTYAHAVASLGFAWNGVTTQQRCASYWPVDAQDPTYAKGGALTNRCYGAHHAPSWKYTLEVTNWLVNGFRVATRDGDGDVTDSICYLALGGLQDAWLGTLTTPTSGGNVSYEDAGFEPDLLLGVATYFSSPGGRLLSAEAGTMAALASDGATHRAPGGQWQNDVSGSSQGNSLVADTFELLDHSATSSILDGTPTLDADGFDINWATVDGTPRYWFVAALSGSTSTTTTTTSSTTTTTTISTTTTSTTTVTTSTTTTSTTTVTTTTTTTLPAVQPGAPPTHWQETGLTISVYAPAVAWASGDPNSATIIPRGSFVERLSPRVVGYSQTVEALGGFWEAEVTLAGGRDYLESWLLDGLGRHLVTYDNAGQVVWEGFVNEVRGQHGGWAFGRGPLLETANHVRAMYSVLDVTTTPPQVGFTAVTPVYEHDEAQQRYGVREEVISMGSATHEIAEHAAEMWLSSHAEPETTLARELAGGLDSRVVLRCVGWVRLLESSSYTDLNSGNVALSAKLANLVDAESNGVLDSGNAQIATNNLNVPAWEDQFPTPWEVIKELVSFGDAALNRYLFGVWRDQEVVYEAAPTAVSYVQRIGDPQREVYTRTGGVVRPWEVLPGRWLLTADFLAGHVPEDVAPERDPRCAFLESVTYTAPYQLSYSGRHVHRVDQHMARWGLSGA